MANHFARLHDGDSALACLRRVLSEFTHPTLYNDTPPLNLDGNFGSASAILEMLLQSHRGELHILPALPAAWREGEVRGLRARGGFTVSFAWKGGRVSWLEIVSAFKTHCRLRTNTALNSPGKNATPQKDDQFYLHEFAMEKGATLRLEAATRAGSSRRPFTRKSSSHAKSTH
jgi:alpha-L-fucosidase 2